MVARVAVAILLFTGVGTGILTPVSHHRSHDAGTQSSLLGRSMKVSATKGLLIVNVRAARPNGRSYWNADRVRRDDRRPEVLIPERYRSIAGSRSVAFGPIFFGWLPARFGGPGTAILLVPLWAISLLGLLPGLGIRHWIGRDLRASRRRAGRCAACGYGPLATGTCPECGG